MKTVKDLMQNLPSSCGKNDSLQLVSSRMSLSNIEFLPVINDHAEVIGTVTYKDIQEAVKRNGPGSQLIVADIMKEEVSVNAYDDEATALRMMRSKHSSYLPVVDERNRLKGIVSFFTLARRIIKLKHELGRDQEKHKVRGLGLSA